MKLLIIAGFLGSGKTTLLLEVAQRLVAVPQKVAIIENEVGEIGIDGKYLHQEGLQVQELFGGCVCCTRHHQRLEDTAEGIEQYHWEVNAHNLDYERHRLVLEQVYPLVFDGTVLETAWLNPGKRGDGLTEIVYDEKLLTIRVDCIGHGPNFREAGLKQGDGNRIKVVVKDVFSSFPSGPVPYFEGGGPYRFFCDAPQLDDVVRIGVSRILPDE